MARHESSKASLDDAPGRLPLHDDADEERGRSEERTIKKARSFLDEIFGCLLRSRTPSPATLPERFELTQPEPSQPDPGPRDSGHPEATHHEPRHPDSADIDDPAAGSVTETTAFHARPGPPSPWTIAAAAFLDKPSTQLSALSCVLIVGAVVTLFHIAYIRTWPGTYAGRMLADSEAREIQPRYWKEDQWRLADVYRKTMNRAVSPCADFQEFACGRSRVPTLSRLRFEIQEAATAVFKRTAVPPFKQTGLQKATALYNLCTNVFALKQNRLAETRDFMLQRGIHWPTEDSSPPTLEEILDVLVDLSINWALHAFFRLSVEPEPMPDGRVALLLLISPDILQWLSKRKELLRRGLYHDFLCRHVSAYLGRGRRGEFEFFVRSFQHADTRVSATLTHTRVPTNSPVRFLEDDETPLPQVPYDVFARALQRHFRANFTIVAVDANTRFLEELAFLFTDFPKIAQTYLAWYALRRIGPAASHQILEASYILESSTRITEAWNRFCFTQVLHVFPLAAALAYSQDSLKGESGRIAGQIVRNVQASLIGLLMEDDRPDLAQEVKTLRKIVSYPISISASEGLYSDVAYIRPGESFLEAWLRTLNATGRRLRGLLGRRTSLEVLQNFLEPLEVRPFYYAPYHAIVIPMGALQPPLFRETFPVAINYGAFGRMVVKVLLDSVATRNLSESRTCLRRAIGPSSFTSRKHDLEVALKLAESELPLLRAVQESTSNETRREERLFGLQEFTAAQSLYIAGCHAACGEPDFLCDLYLQHSDRFAQVFNCSYGTRMSPQEKCLLW